ncbi:MAG: flippase-like domain-containing protein [Alphaproteobacteria bacterium]|nr:flippase-like domain-containing protein [Alphaproteobacteria bacterium]MCW5739697.1 flippase-like domain-containing protein [Alphaproteobacteria bacterium]
MSRSSGPDVGTAWRRRALLWLAGGLLASMLVATAVFALGESQTMLETLSRISPGVVLGCLGLSLVNYVTRAIRWHLYTRGLGLGVSLPRDTLYYVAGFSMTVTPGKIGEALRLWFLRRGHGHGYERTLALVAADRIADAAALVIIALLGIALLQASVSAIVPMAAITLVAVFLMVRPRYLAIMVGWGYGVVRRKPRLFGRLRIAVNQLAKLGSPWRLLAALLLSLLGWFAEAVQVWWVVRALGGAIDIWGAAVAFAVSMVVGSATMLPGGLGGTEIGMVALLTQRGVSFEIAVTATALVRLTTLWFSVALGMGCLPLAMRRVTREATA